MGKGRSWRCPMTRIQIITSDEDTKESCTAKLSEAGYSIKAGPMTEALRKKLVKDPPKAIIIDLNRAPATGRDLGLYLRVQKATRQCLLIYLGGTAAKVAGIRALLPDAIFTDADDLIGALEAGLAHPPAEPHVPDSVFAGYAGRPLSAKLGIKAGMQIALVDAPDGALNAIEPLPEEVEVSHSLQKQPDIALWFTRSEEDLRHRLPDTLKRVSDGKLWVLWPKQGSGVEGDLTQPVVRKHGLDAGWVDFKVCSFDDTWTGLCFTARKSQ